MKHHNAVAIIEKIRNAQSEEEVSDIIRSVRSKNWIKRLTQRELAEFTEFIYTSDSPASRLFHNILEMKNNVEMKNNEN